MSLPRFYVDPASVSGGQARLAATERDHLVRVLRLGPGDEVVLFDGAGREYPGRVLETGRREAVVAVGEPRPAAADAARARVVLLQGLPRLARMDWLVEKATEAGVSTLVPVLARRSPPEARRAAGRSTLNSDKPISRLSRNDSLNRRGTCGVYAARGGTKNEARSSTLSPFQ